MKYTKFDTPALVQMTPRVFRDERGFFMETFRQSEFDTQCGNYTFVQDNHSKSARGTLRGLHYQFPPTAGQWIGVMLSEENQQMLWIPPGFAHAFYVTSDHAEFQYKCTAYYAPRVSEKDGNGLLFKDAPYFE